MGSEWKDEGTYVLLTGKSAHDLIQVLRDHVRRLPEDINNGCRGFLSDERLVMCKQVEQFIEDRRS